MAASLLTQFRVEAHTRSTVLAQAVSPDGRSLFLGHKNYLTQFDLVVPVPVGGAGGGAVTADPAPAADCVYEVDLHESMVLGLASCDPHWLLAVTVKEPEEPEEPEEEEEGAPALDQVGQPLTLHVYKTHARRCPKLVGKQRLTPCARPGPVNIASSGSRVAVLVAGQVTLFRLRSNKDKASVLPGDVVTLPEASGLPWDSLALATPEGPLVALAGAQVAVMNTSTGNLLVSRDFPGELTAVGVVGAEVWVGNSTGEVRTLRLDTLADAGPGFQVDNTRSMPDTDGYYSSEEEEEEEDGDEEEEEDVSTSSSVVTTDVADAAEESEEGEEGQEGKGKAAEEDEDLDEEEEDDSDDDPRQDVVSLEFLPGLWQVVLRTATNDVFVYNAPV